MNVAKLASRELILFDLDGTLVDSVPDLHRVMNLALADLQLPQVTQAHVRVWVGKGASQLCRSALLHVTRQDDPDLHAKLLQIFMSLYATDACEHTTVYAGVYEFLQHCREQNKKMACVTNKPQVPAQTVLKVLQLEQYFDVLVGGDQLPERKPHPLPLLYCLEQFGVSNDKALMIGDSSNDVEAARRAGVDCIVLSYGYNHGEDIHACQPQQVIDNLKELIA